MKIDNTRDKFSNKEDRKITVEEDIPGEFYTLVRDEKGDRTELKLALSAEINYVSPNSKIYKDIFICSYSKQKYPSFYGKVIESRQSYIIVEPNESEEIRKSCDKFSIGLGKNNDAIYEVGSNVKITYTGVIRETYPAQIDALQIELKSVEEFELIFHEKEEKSSNTIDKVLDKTENKYYTIYSYKGEVSIKLKGKEMLLREALLNNEITMDEIIAKANQDLKDKKIQGDMYKDGGSTIYKYKDYTILKYHTLEGNRDVYIGVPEMDINVAK